MSAIDNDDLVIEAISNYIYQTISHVDRHRRGWLNHNSRDFSWQSKDFQVNFTAKLAKILSLSKDKDGLVSHVIDILNLFLSPPFFVSVDFVNLLTKIRKYTHPALEIEAKQLNNSSAPKTYEILDEYFAILLLDAENLTVDDRVEKILTNICQYPLKLKFAFANWRSLGKKDGELHNRGYELIHVPPGKNSADKKMISFGPSISINYPQAKEVFVCSSDGDLNPLCTQLETDNLTVYRVSRREEQIRVSNSKTGEHKTYSLIVMPEIPPLEDFINLLKDIIRSEQKRTGKNWINLATISSLFKVKYNLPLSQIVAYHLPGQKVKNFFHNLKNSFVVHQLGDTKIYITLFELDDRQQAKNPELKSITHTQVRQIVDIQTYLGLETALFRIVQSLSIMSDREEIPINEVAIQFQKLYTISITKAMRRLNLGSKFPKFLQSHSSLKLKKVDNSYSVSVGQE